MKRFRVERVYYDDLPKEIEKIGLSNNGRGKEWSSYILIWCEDELIEWYSDAMEPEDASFWRDLDWIAPALKRAYERGLEDGEEFRSKI